MIARLWRRRPWWLVDATLAALCALSTVSAVQHHRYAWFGFGAFVVGMMVASLVAETRLRALRKQRDEAWEFSDRVLALVEEQRRGIEVVLDHTEPVTRRSVTPKDRAN